VCHDGGGGIQRDGRAQGAFLTAPYWRDEEGGQWRPLGRVDQCPFAQGPERCRIRAHDWRNRKTGPSVSLRVLKCLTHARAFTVYPPGYVPYGRQSWLPLDLRGDWVNRPEGEDGGFEGCEFRGLRGCEARQALAE
jgi:hypothetical protein